MAPKQDSRRYKPLAMKPTQQPDSSLRLQPYGRQQDRAQALEACQACRQRKTKCDTLRPCSLCQTKQIRCQYETLNGETRKQASKRKHEAMSQAFGTYEQLFNLLKHRSPREAAAVVDQIRDGLSPEEILRLAARKDAFASHDPRGAALSALLANLLHSTGSLKGVVNLALQSAMRLDLPDSREFNIMCNRIVHLPFIEELLHGRADLENNRSPARLICNAGIPLDVHSQLSLNAPKDTPHSTTMIDDHPPHRVQATPWTTINESDEGISHLVSLFLAWINPSWRFVEEDLFLRSMQSRQSGFGFCSSLLVNSICAIASLHSEHEVAFIDGSRERITRGEHFHDEALRLWTLEECRPSMTNIQALCILALESNYRARDRLGLTLINIAVQLDRQVPINIGRKRHTAQHVSESDYVRARLSTHWMVECTHIIMRLAFMSNATAPPQISGFPEISSVFEDRVALWIGYPIAKDSVSYRPTLYLQERCRLAKLFEEVHHLLCTGGEEHHDNIQEFAYAVEGLSAKMKYWYEHLPIELSYEWPMSIAVWELHASYLAFSMLLRVVARSRLLKTEYPPQEHSGVGTLSHEDDDVDEKLRSQLAQENLSHAIPLARRAARILRDFRERYGLKITPAWLLQLQAVAVNVLLLDPELQEPIPTLSQETLDDIAGRSRDAFDEVFRCLLGTAVEVMIARAISRMTYHTTVKHRIMLSRQIWSLLQVMSDTAWRPSDLELVNSVFPNFATIQGQEDEERMTELLSKWESIDID